MWFHDTGNEKIMVKDYSEAMSSLRVLQAPRKFMMKIQVMSHVSASSSKIDNFLLINEISNSEDYDEE